eukprot:7482472-Alexandrium_andersonii.AAC.1
MDSRRSSATAFSRLRTSSSEVKICPEWPSQAQSTMSFRLDIAPSGAASSWTVPDAGPPADSSLG